MTFPGNLLRDQSGSGAAEFALVLPIALLLFFGIIDGGRYVWSMNKLEKAVQAGTRYAVATDVIPAGLNEVSYIGFSGCPGADPLPAGDTICKDALGTISCSRTGSNVSCVCTASALGADSCPDLGTPDSNAFNNIVRRMHVLHSGIDPDDVEVRYGGSGIGYAGDPSVDDDGDPKSEIAPIVTVVVQNVRLRPMLLFGGSVRLPTFSYSQTLEDGDGAIAY